MNEKLPLRSVQAPFVPVNLPEPFENAKAAQVKVPFGDDPRTAMGVGLAGSRGGGYRHRNAHSDTIGRDGGERRRARARRLRSDGRRHG